MELWVRETVCPSSKIFNSSKQESRGGWHVPVQAVMACTEYGANGLLPPETKLTAMELWTHICVHVE